MDYGTIYWLPLTGAMVMIVTGVELSGRVTVLVLNDARHMVLPLTIRVHQWELRA